MKLTLQRQWFTDKSTCGELFIDGQQFCYTLELPNKDGLPGSCIPQGVYRVAYLYSPRFGRNMPHLLDIPNRSSILIHWGNTDVDTEGCILLGLTHTEDFIGESRNAFDAFLPQFLAGLKAGDVTIEVIGGAMPQSNHEAVQAAATGEA